MVTKKKYTNEFQQRDILEKWRASGLSQAEFCRREGISEWKLSSWKRRELHLAGKAPKPKSRTRKKAASAKIEFAAADEVPSSPAQRKNHRAGAPQFVPVVAPAPEQSVEEILRSARRTPVAELCFGDISVRVWRGIDQDTLRLLIQTIKETSLC